MRSSSVAVGENGPGAAVAGAAPAMAVRVCLPAAVALIVVAVATGQPAWLIAVASLTVPSLLLMASVVVMERVEAPRPRCTTPPRGRVGAAERTAHTGAHRLMAAGLAPRLCGSVADTPADAPTAPAAELAGLNVTRAHAAEQGRAYPALRHGSQS